MTDSTRAAFEAWAESAGFSIETLDHIAAYPQGTYGDSRTHGAWAGYQAARKAALEEAANVCAGNHLLSGGNGPNFSFGWETAIKASAEAIRALADGATKEGTEG